MKGIYFVSIKTSSHELKLQNGVSITIIYADVLSV